MASSALCFSPSSVFVLLLCFTITTSQPTLDPSEQESVYQVLESINSDVSWRSLFPDDLCLSAPHGVVCDYFTPDPISTTPTEAHVTELNFGSVSDYSPNPPCTPTSTLPRTHLLSPLTHLRKLFFYKCFTQKPVPFFGSGLPSSLEELIFIQNPSLVGSISGSISNLTALRRLVLTGNNISGEIPSGLFGSLTNIEQITLSGNGFTGEISSLDLSKLKKLRLVDLSHNVFWGNLSGSIGGLTGLLKLDLSWNGFSGQIPEGFKGLKSLEFLDLSYNSFANCGVPLFLGEMGNLKEVYMSGNLLGGRIPEIWKNLGGMLGIGLSGNGLVGNIPASMGVFLRNLSYLWLDNNNLVGTVPEEFGRLEMVNELNLEHNKLCGRVPFSADFASKVGEKLKLEGNPELCVEEGVLLLLNSDAKIGSSLSQLKVCSFSNKPDVPISALLDAGDGGSSSYKLHVSHMFMLIFVGFLFTLVEVV